jgi:tetratricopeptide (TPR) repeat protein
MVDALGMYWLVMGSGNLGEAHELSSTALADPQAQAPTRERSSALWSLGMVEEVLGKIDATQAACEEGAAIAREVGDEGLVAKHLCGIAMQLYRLGEYTRSNETAQEALEIAAAVGDPNILALAHDRRAIAGTLGKQFDEARAHFAAALRLCEHTGNRWRMSITYNNLADNEMAAGDLTAARAAVEAAMECGFTFRTRAALLVNLGTLTLLEGDFEAAQVHCRDALRKLIRTGRSVDVPNPLLGLAICAHVSENLERAGVLHGAATAWGEAQGVPFEHLEADLRDRDIAALQLQMGETAYVAAYSRGYELSRPDALALALAADEQDLGPRPAGQNPINDATR